MDDHDDHQSRILRRGAAHEAGVESRLAVSAASFADVGGAGLAENVPRRGARLRSCAADDRIAKDSLHPRRGDRIDRLWHEPEALAFLPADDVAFDVQHALDDVRLD